MKTRWGLMALLSFSVTFPLKADDQEYYFRFLIHSRSELDRLTHIMSVDKVVGDTVYAYANSAQHESMRNLDYRFELLPHPSSLYEHRMGSSRGDLLAWDKYPTYPAYLSLMRQYANSFPSLCRVDTIGLSLQGRLLLAVKISSNVGANQDKPEFFYTSTIHGDETVGYVLTLRLIDYLLHTYAQPTAEGERVTRLVDNMEIWINPLANPDGTYRNGADTTVGRATRGNAHGVDLNRNFPDRTRDSNSTAGREPETQAFMRFGASHNFNLSANFHGGAQVANYPWDNGAPSGTYAASPDDQWFIAVSRAYATPNQDLMTGGFPNGITNGCAWYAVFGGRQDWMYYWHGGREVTIELWNTKNPAGSVLPQRWTNNKESFLAYMEQALKGVRGTVTDARTGRPLRARIDVPEFPGAPVYSDSAVGDYHRLLLPGQYTLSVSADGYLSRTILRVMVTDSAATRVDAALEPSVTAEKGGGRSQRVALEQNYPNPFNPSTTIRFSLDHPAQVKLGLYDILGRTVAALKDERLEAGEHQVVVDGTGLTSGLYFYRLQAGTFVQARTMLLLK